MIPFARSCLALAAALALGTVPAAAQIRGVAGVGLSVPVGDFADEDDGAAKAGGVNALAGIEWLPEGRSYGLRLDGTYARFCTDACDEDGGDLDVKYRILNANASGILELGRGDAGRVRPYLLAGVGIYNYKLHGDDVPDALEDAETDFGVSAGAGVNVAVGRVGVFVEGRFHNVFAEGSDLQYIPVSVGVRFGLR